MGLSLLETSLLQFLWFRKLIYVITLDSEEVLSMHMQFIQDGIEGRNSSLMRVLLFTKNVMIMVRI